MGEETLRAQALSPRWRLLSLGAVLNPAICAFVVRRGSGDALPWSDKALKTQREPSRCKPHAPDPERREALPEACEAVLRQIPRSDGDSRATVLLHTLPQSRSHCLTSEDDLRFAGLLQMGRAGFEPATLGLKVRHVK